MNRDQILKNIVAESYKARFNSLNEAAKQAPIAPGAAAGASGGGSGLYGNGDVEILAEILDEWGDGGEVLMVKHVDHYVLESGTLKLDIPCLGVALPLLDTNEPPASIGCIVDLELDGGGTQLICPTSPLPLPSPFGIEGTFTLPKSTPKPALLCFSLSADGFPNEANFRITINGTCMGAKGVGVEELPCDQLIINNLTAGWSHMYALIDANNQIQYMWDADALTPVYTAP